MSNRQKAIANLMVAANPEVVAPTVFPKAGAPYDLIEEMGVEAKFSAICDGISGGLGFAGDSAATRSGEAAGLRPWLDDVSPLIRLESIEAEYARNEAVIDALTAHLVEHVVIREDLRAQAERARRHAAVENRRIPEFLEDFAQRLVAAGVIKGDLRFLSKARFDGIVALIRGLAENGGDGSPLIAGSVPEGGREMVFPHGRDDVGSAGAPEADRMPDIETPISGEGHSGDGSRPLTGDGPVPQEGGSDVPDEEPEVMAEPVPEVVAELVQPVVPQAPPGRWDVIDVERLGYRIEDDSPSSDEELSVLRMRLPEVDSIRDLALPQGLEKTMLENVEAYGDLGIADRLVRSWAKRENVRMTDAEVRVWVFLLVIARGFGKQPDDDALGAYDGLVLPGRKGSARIRRVRFGT